MLHVVAPMVQLLFSIFRDLYVVLLVILVIEQIPGGDLLHNMTRKGVISVTVCLLIAKLVQPFMDSRPTGLGRGPQRSKKSEGGLVSAMEWASVEMQGWRPAMEDATCVVDSLPSPLGQQALFGVFDGHGGSQVSLIASSEFPKVLAACAAGVWDGNSEASSDAKENDKDAKDAVVGGKAEANSLTERVGKALHLAMLRMDANLRKTGAAAGEKDSPTNGGPLGIMASRLEGPERRNAFSLVGSTAIVVLVDYSEADGKPKRLAVANCGDSRAVLCRGGDAVELSEDHKPELPEEEERIKNAGGHVALIGLCHRIDGWGLNLSRALGDFHYKARADLPPEEQKVSCVPEIRFLELKEEDEFLVLGCDGIFELHDSQKAVDVVRSALQADRTVREAAELLVDKSCSPDLALTRGRGGDNCSAIVLKLR